MRKIFVVAEFILTALSCRTSSTKLAHGTTLMAVIVHDTILMCADTKSRREFTGIENDVEATHKIIILGRNLFMSAGVLELNVDNLNLNFNVRRIVENTYDTSKSMRENVALINKIIGDSANLVFNSTSFTDRLAWRSRFPTADKEQDISFAFCGIVNGTPRIISGEYKIHLNEKFSFLVTSLGLKDSTGDGYCYLAGLHDHIIQYINENGTNYNNLSVFMGGMVELEAHYHPNDVDSVFDLAIITKDGYTLRQGLKLINNKSH